MTYSYKRTEPHLWTVGYHDPDGRWQAESDHDSPADAAARVAWLNGSGEPAAPAGLMLTPRDRRTLLAALADAAAYRTQQAGQQCEGCEDRQDRHEIGPCEDHTADLDQAETYRALARRIGGRS